MAGSTLVSPTIPDRPWQSATGIARGSLCRVSLAEKLREYGVLVALNLIAVAAGVLLITSAPWRIGVAVGAVALVAVAVHVLSRDSGPLAARSGGHRGATIPAQLMLVAAAAGACLRARPQASTLPAALSRRACPRGWPPRRPSPLPPPPRPDSPRSGCPATGRPG